jgi:uncharacterized protein YbcC (UPF0753/DUF2309 family)
MKTWNKIIMQAKVEDKAIKQTTTGNDYMAINLVLEKQIKDKTFKTYYKAMIWDDKKIEECRQIKVGDYVLVTGAYDPSNYKVDGTKLDSGKDYYKQSNNINISTIEKLPIGEIEEQEEQEQEDPIAKVKKKHEKIESTLSDDLDDEIPF